MAVKQEPQQMSDIGDQEDGYEVLASNEYTGVDPRSDKYELSSYIFQLHIRTNRWSVFREAGESWCKCPPPDGKGELGCQGEECDNRARRVECDLMLCRCAAILPILFTIVNCSGCLDMN